MKKLLLSTLLFSALSAPVLAQEPTDFKKGLNNIYNKGMEYWNSREGEAVKDWAKNDVAPLVTGTAKEGARLAYDTAVPQDRACRKFWEKSSYVRTKPAFNSKGTSAFEDALQSMPPQKAEQVIADMGFILRNFSPSWEKKQIMESPSNIPIDGIGKRLDQYFSAKGFQNKFRCVAEGNTGNFLSSIDAYIDTLAKHNFTGARGQFKDVKQALNIK